MSKNTVLKVRLAKSEDLSVLLDIYSLARSFMIKNGNPTQWGKFYPRENIIVDSIKKKETFVIVDKNGCIRGTYALILGEDPTYKTIKKGKWLNDKPYLTLHRCASDFTNNGIFKTMLNHALTYKLDIRIDTHKDNKVMRFLLKKYGFIQTGLIYVKEKGLSSTRLAFQKVFDK
ncbi:MAG: GNAT family N-acetyltransferase [Bacilli bacterium]|nr:GNAT family N-acetyltransferase [Bacilli bacterium]